MDLFDLSNDFTLPFDIPKEISSKVIPFEKNKGFKITIPGGEIFYSKRFFEEKICNRCLEYFQENDSFDWGSSSWKSLSQNELSAINFKNINWEQDFIRLYGKKIPLPRLTSWYGEQGREYSYSGITSKPNEWNKGLLYLKDNIETVTGNKFNSVLLNWYRDGEDYLNWHSDDEPELGPNPVIASANFGETRDFIIRRKEDKSQKIKIPLTNGTLLVMSGELQTHWEHCVPKRKKVYGSRFNLTFRLIS